jgi:DNA-binding NarL/FixJ family response regulator
VLIADDQELIHAGFRLILELAGLEVAGEASDGAQALELALRDRVQAVVPAYESGLVTPGFTA